MNHDYIPTKEAVLLPFAKNLYAYAQTHFSRWQVPGPQSFLQTLIERYEAALVIYHDPNHGKIDTLNKNEAKKALTGALRTYVQGFLARNPTVTDEDREKMGLSIRDTTATTHHEPGIKPESDATPSGKGRHTVTAMNPLLANKRKPPLVTGVSFACRLRLPSEPKIPAEQMPSVYQTGTVKHYQWGEADYGKIADYASAYEAEGGKRGPWSDVVSLIIS